MHIFKPSAARYAMYRLEWRLPDRVAQADEAAYVAPRKYPRLQATAIGAPPPDHDEGLLARLLGQYIAPEMLGLWLIEVTLCAALFFVMMGTGGSLLSAEALRAVNRAVALALTFGLTSAAVGLYSSDTYMRTRGLLINTGVGALLAFPAFWLVGHAVGLDLAGLPGEVSQLAIKVLLAWILLLFGLRLTFSYALRANMFLRRVVIVGADRGASRMQSAIAAERGGAFKVISVLPPDDAAALEPQALRQGKVWAVILTASAFEALPGRELLRARERGVRLYSDTDFWERRLRRIDIDQPGSDWRHGEAAASESGTSAAVRRAADIGLSLFMVTITLPLMLITAAAIACESRGPVLYKQERVGLHGRCFTVLKFRSMRRDAEARGPVWASQRDPRVTRVGAFIRLTRIDELPQLFNILRGQMSFIGPRPERPHFVAQLEQSVPFYSDRHLAKPGLTGWAQVNYPYGASVEDARAKLSYDLYYVKHRGLLLDLMILLATVRVVLFQRGAR